MKEFTNLQFAVTLMAAALCSVANAQYTKTILNPPGATFSIAMDAGGGQQGGFAGSGIPTARAVVWTGTGGSAVDLHPPGLSTSRVYGVFGGDQVGLGAGAATGHAVHALMWSGTAASVVSLHPTGFVTSIAYDLEEVTQVGEGMTDAGEVHAILWTGTAASALDLHPVGYASSMAYSVHGGKQLGFAVIDSQSHAMLWSGSAASAMDLNPAGITTSVGYGMDGKSQVGNGNGLATGGADHALLWSDTPNAIDLNPVGFAATYARGVANGEQVGYGIGSATGNVYHALVWNGSAGSFVDLHPFLGTGYTSSYAYGIDPVTGQIVGEAMNTLGRHVAVMWTPTVRRVRPLGYTVTVGTEFDGNLSSLFSSDDDSLTVFNDDTSLVAQILITGTSPIQVPTTLTLRVEGSVARFGLSMEIALWNYVSGSYSIVDGRVAPTADTMIETSLTGSAPAHVGPSGELKTRVTWQPINDEDPSQDGWLHAIDLLEWLVQ